jgi:hypothetical protein
MTATPMPSTVEEVYAFLTKEVTWLHARWILFEQLYNKSTLRLDLLNEAAPSFFHVLQLLMFDDMQLSLSRLTDSAPQKASLLQLQKRLESNGNAKLAAKTEIVLDTLMKTVDAIRGQRDKRIAHYSLEQAINSCAEKLPAVDYQSVLVSLSLVREYMNLIEDHYYGLTQGYEHFAWQDDGDTIVLLLKWALNHKERLLAQEVSAFETDKWSGA